MSLGDIRVAVCVTGLVRAKNRLGSVEMYNRHAKSIFPYADFYYSTWSSNQEEFEKNLPSDTCFYYDEPKNPYHPYLDVSPENYLSLEYAQMVAWARGLTIDKKEWTKHHAKQIVNYAHLMKDIPKDYDVMVRIRFDSVINKRADFRWYIENCYKTGNVHGFGVTRQNLFNDFYDSDMKGLHKIMLLDQCIIHRFDRINPDSALDAYKEKKLLAAEYGWYQVLSHPYGGIHKNHHGFINHDGHVQDRFIREHILE